MFIKNVILIVLYFIFAKLCQIIAIDPGNITAIWIPSGLCFMAVYLYGYNLLYGVFFGAFFANTTAYMFPLDSVDILSVFFAGFLNGIGDLLSIFIGVNCVCKFSNGLSLFHQTKTTISFLIFGVLIGPTVSAIFGVTGLAMNQFISWSAYNDSFLTWFIGDAIGVLLVVPVFVVLFSGNYKLIKISKKKLLELICILSVLLFTIFNALNFEVNKFLEINIPLMMIIPLLALMIFRHEDSIAILCMSMVAVCIPIIVFHKGKVVHLNNIKDVILDIQYMIFSIYSTLLILISSINENRQMQKMMLHQERLAILGEMSAGLAHEINNPIAIINASIFVLKKEFTEIKFYNELFQKMDNASSRISRIVQGLRKFSYDSEVSLKSIHSLDKIIKSSIELTEARLNFYTVRINANIDTNLKIFCDEIQMQQVIINLINNSIDGICTMNDPWICVKAKIVSSQLLIQIIDSGNGIESQHVDKIFNPFYTTKEIGKGTGLGLSISKGIISAHNGNIIYLKEDGNTCFQISLPVVPYSNGLST